MTTGLWSDNGRTPAPVPSGSEPDFQMIEQCQEHCLKNDRNWEQYFEQNRIRPFTLYYEDFVQRREDTAIEVLRYIGVAPAEPVTFGPWQMRKQADAISEEWVRQYRLYKEGQGAPEPGRALS
jgi:LPS sulfotransferase NodH